MKEFAVDRSRWLRGSSTGSVLQDSQGHRCCLGFFMAACGFSADRLFDVGLPEDVEGMSTEGEAGFLVREREDDEGYIVGVLDSAVTDRLVGVNDFDSLTDDEREKQIADEFAKHGVRVSFVDSVPLATVAEGEKSNG